MTFYLHEKNMNAIEMISRTIAIEWAPRLCKKYAITPASNEKNNVILLVSDADLNRVGFQLHYLLMQLLCCTVQVYSPV